MKKVFILIIFLLIFMVSVFIGKKVYENLNTVEIQGDVDKKAEKIEDETNIIQRGEMNTRALFELENGDASYEINLMENDMIWDDDTRLYYKIITSMEDYNVYKERLYLPEINNTDFENKFVIILANENQRDIDEKDLIIYDVVDDGVTSHIIVKQRENPSEYRDNNVLYAFVNKSVLREQIDVEIQTN